MTGLRCPNCGFYNLSARSKCARCGKALPEISEQPSTKSLFEEEQDKATGSGSIPKAPSAPAAKIAAEPGVASGSMPKISAPPPAAPQKGEAGAGTGSGAIPKAATGPDTFSGSVITAEVVETTAGNKQAPKVEPRPEPAAKMPAVPEVPSFDDSAASKVGTEAELGELSEFFKDAKQKPAAKAPAPKPASPKPARPAPPAPAREEPLEFQDQEPAAASASREEPGARSEDSMSRIKIKSTTETSHPSEFNPDFAEPVFPDFSASGSDASKSKSVSEVSRPLAAKGSSITLAGVIDLAVYGAIAAIFSLAGLWASATGISRPGADFIIPLAIVLLVVVWFYQVFFISVLGQTLGQMLAGIQVLDKAGNRIPLGRASLRAFVYILCLLPLGLGFIPSLLGSSLPDMAGQTKPVRW